MTPSDACLEIIRQCEGIRLRPYLCPAGIPTIGYGSTRYEDGTPVRMSDAPITDERADDLMRRVLATEYAPAVSRYVQAPINQHQFDALVSFAYNVGPQNLRTSTLLRKLNAKDYAGAAREFDRWVTAAGKPLPGLVKRRAMERALFERKP